MQTSHTPVNQFARRIGPLLIEAITGAGIGLLLAVGGGYLGPVLVRSAENGWNDLVASVLGMLIGYITGAPLGVIASARLLRRPGVAWRAVLGSIVGGVAIMLLAEPLRLNQYSWLLLLSFASAALIGALVGYQRWRPNREHQSDE